LKEAILGQERSRAEAKGEERTRQRSTREIKSKRVESIWEEDLGEGLEKED
jgi:hypothetical protein